MEDETENVQPEKEEAVRVAVRIRPLIPKEQLERCRTFISSTAGALGTVEYGKDRRFTFDYVYDEQATQEGIYREAVRPLLDGVFDGYSCCCLAYGQTGSGKTYTMGSAVGEQQETEVGIIPRVIRDLYAEIERRRGEARFVVRCIFLEIYNEEVRDLLHGGTPSKNIAIRDDGGGTVVVMGVRDEPAPTLTHLMRLLAAGSAARTVGSTLMNDASSRSHAVFSLLLEQARPAPGGGTEWLTSKFNLVDLAGSERQKKTGASGSRFKESVNINSGLLALMNVISALGDETRKATHVPYRESKLTRLLQDSLGGNSRTLFLACVSPADTNFDETVNTLKYANRAKNIRNRPTRNRAAPMTGLEPLQEEIAALREQLERERAAQEGREGPVARLEAELAAARAAAEEARLEAREAREEARAASEEKERLAAALAAAPKTLAPRPPRTPPPGTPEPQTPEPPDGGSETPASGARTRRIFSRRPRTAERQEAAAGCEAHEKRIGELEAALAAAEGRAAAAEAALAAQGRELQEARDDLQRDEAIFAERMKEFKRLQRARKEEAAEREALAKAAAALQARVAELEARLAAPPPAPASPPLAPATPASHRPLSRPSSSSALPTARATPERERGEWAEPAESSFDGPEHDAHAAAAPSEGVAAVVAQMEGEAAREAAAWARREEAAEERLRAVDENIRLKEEVVAELARGGAAVGASQRELEGAVREYEERVRAQDEELARLQAEVEALESAASRNEAEVRRVKERYESKVRAKEAQLAALQKKQREAEHMLKIKVQDERRLATLTDELQQLRKDSSALKQKIKEDGERHEAAMGQRAKEIAHLRREAETSQRRIRELETENERQRAVIRRTESRSERAAPQQPPAMHVQGRPAPVSSVRATAAGRPASQQTARGERKGSATSSAASTPEPALDQQRAWLEREIEKVTRRQEAQEALQRELERREGAVKAHEAALRAMSALEMKAMRGSAVLNSRLQQAADRIEALDAQLAAARDRGAHATAEALQREVHEAYAARAELQRAAELKKFLTAEEERARSEMADRIDALEAEIEYTDTCIADLRAGGGAEAAESSAPDHDVALPPNMSAGQAAGLLKRCLGKLGELRRAARWGEQRAVALQAQLEEARRARDGLEGRLQLAQLEFDRRLTQQLKEHEQKVHFLLQQMDGRAPGGPLGPGASSEAGRSTEVEKMLRFKEEQISILDKDIFYYKNTNRELKRKLRQVTATAEGLSGRLEERDGELAQLRSTNADLVVELSNVKARFRSVRVSAAQLHELSPGEPPATASDRPPDSARTGTPGA